MAHCSPLCEDAASLTEVEDIDEAVVAAELEHAFEENPAASNGEKCLASPDARDTLSEGGSDNENLRRYYFRSSITIGKIKEMVEKGYFSKGRPRAPGAETVPEPDNNEVVVYEDFFVAGLCMTLHLALADILLHFQGQLHELTTKAIAQLSKYFCIVGSFGGVPSGNAFAKWCELHYQPKTVQTPEGDRIAQYGCLNFHAKRYGSPKVSFAITNKWSSGWTKSWFYCRVPCRWSSEGGKSVHALHSQMSVLDYAIEPKVECLDNDPNDAAFVRATATIGGRDGVEDYVACKLYPLAASFVFESVPLGMTPVSKVDTPLPLFVVGNAAAEHAIHVLVEVETEAKKVLGSFRPKEHDALRMANIPNGGHLNWILEQMGMSYTPRPLSGSKASQAAIKKQKAEVSKKPTVKRVKVDSGRATPSKTAPPSPPKMGPTKKISILMIAQLKAKPGPRGTSEIELAYEACRDV
jgi:hypothetical protein